MTRGRWAVAVMVCTVLGACAGESEGDAAAEAETGAMTLEQFAANPQSHTGQSVTLEGIAVASRMGEQAFWMELPNETPYLIKLDHSLVDGGLRVASGERYTISGQVVSMSDSVLAAWEQSGAVADEGQKAEAQFATSFLEARRAERTSAAGGQAQ